MSRVTDNPGESRYELDTPDGLAFAAYRRDGDVVVFTHTIVPDGAQGQGAASTLIKSALVDVRAHGRHIASQCEFVSAYLERHPQERDLLAM